MAAVGSAPLRAHGTTTSTTAETWQLTSDVNQVFVSNSDTDPVYVTLATGTSAAGALANVTTAVAEADDTICVLPSTRVCILRQNRRTYVAGSVIGNASLVHIEGFRQIVQ